MVGLLLAPAPLLEPPLRANLAFRANRPFSQTNHPTKTTQVHLFDLRKPSAPLAVAPGHSKAVSYVRFLPGGRLVSASTDGTLRVWSVAALAAAGAGGAGEGAAFDDACEVILTGHTNERNFIGLAVSPDSYVACGSETNEVVCYHRSLPPPVARYCFSGVKARGGAGGTGGGAGGAACCRGKGGRGCGPDGRCAHVGGGAGGGDEGHFVSSVCWSKRHGTLLAGNSAGHIKVLQLI